MTHTKVTVRPFDFRQSHRLSADQMRTLERIHIHWASLLATYLTAYLRSRVVCTLKEMSQSVFEDILGALPSGSVVTTASLDPLPGSVLLRLDGTLSHGFIDRLLGGSGEIRHMDRALTEIDAQVLERGMPVVFEALSEAWSGVEKIRAQVKTIELAPQFLRLTSPQEAVVEIALEMAFGGIGGTVSLFLPYDVLKPVLPRLSSVALLAEPDEVLPTDMEGTRRLRGLLLGATLALTVVLGEAVVSVRDFLNLAPGDVLVLAQKAADPLRVEVGGRPKFLGQPRARGRHVALVITDIPEKKGWGGP